MKIAILHYHLNPGGVTQVMINQLKALDEAPTNEGLEALVLHGGRQDAWPTGFADSLQHIRLRTAAVPGLDYDEGKVAGERLFSHIIRVLQESGFSTNETVLHVHNLTLGKNVSLPSAVASLVEQGYRCLIQIHDFAEDFRPENFCRLETGFKEAIPPVPFDRLYPQASSVHYATLTSRDGAILEAAGIPPGRLHTLPNPVIASKPQAEREPSRHKLAAACEVDAGVRWFLYPVRGIRRKNIGEAVLWAALGGRENAVAITLPPLNPVELSVYRRWQSLAQSCSIQCLFDVGVDASISYDQNLAAADAILTTSVAEGFGMVFLESWLRGKPLVGRNLPEITGDFVRLGVHLASMYDRLAIPLDAVDQRGVRDSFRAIFDEATRAYAREVMSDADFQAAWQHMTDDGHIDFAYLDRESQERLIDRVVHDAGAREAVLECNPKVQTTLVGEMVADQALIEANAERIRRALSPAAAGRQLEQTLAVVSAAEPAGEIEGLPGVARVLDAFLRPERFHPIRVELLPDGTQQMEVVEILRRRSRPLQPIATAERPRLEALANIRAVIFDVYGTMVVSGSGEVGTAEASAASDSKATALRDAWKAAELPGIPEDHDGPAELVEAIHRHHAQSRAAGIDYPEVDIVAVWREVVERKLREQKLPQAVNEHQLHVLAAEYEAGVNPVWPMPGLLETLAELRERGLILGIISNAQFFTPAVFPALVSRSLDELGFARNLEFFSYQGGRAKPGSAMFEQAVDGLRDLGMSAENALYVGNDMRNDMAPALSAGLRTALFAGDQRSLRLRPDDPMVVGIRPDIVLTELLQLSACLK